MIFHGKIDEYVARNHENVATDIYSQNDRSARKEQIEELKRELEQRLKEKQDRALSAENKADDEFNTGASSGIPGDGPIYRQLRGNARKLRQEAVKYEENEYTNTLSRYNEELERIENEEKQKDETIKNIKKKNDLITRYYAFSSLTDSDGTMRFVAWIIRILFIVFEIVPILSKALMSDKNEYENLRAKIEGIKGPIYEKVINKIHERMFGEAFDKKSTGKFEQLSGFMEEEYHKAQLMNKGLNDLNHFWRYNGYK